MKHLNEQEEFNLNEVEEHADEIVVRLSKIHVEKVLCWGPLNVEINMYLYMYVLPFGVHRERMHEEINWN